MMILGVQPYSMNRASQSRLAFSPNSQPQPVISAGVLNSPRFGLKGDALKHHPAFNRQLVKGKDLTIGDDGSLHPSQGLVQEAADVILKDGPNDPRALVITNVADFIPNFDYTPGSGSMEKVQAFQRELFSSAWELVKEQRYTGTQAKDFLVHQYVCEDGPKEHIRYVRPEKLPLNLRYIKYPNPKRPYLTSDDIMYAHSYGPMMNVRGGNLKLVDFVQFMEDKNLRFEDVFEEMRNSEERAFFIKEEWLGKPLEPYSVEIKVNRDTETDKPVAPIVFVNNQKLCHYPMATDPVSTDFVKGTHLAQFYRTTVKPNRRSDFWQENAPFPYHTEWTYKDKAPKF